jgi:hypothetical protein
MTEKTVPDAIMKAVQAGQEYHAKVMQFAAANSQAAVDYFQKLAATRAPSEVIELTATHLREQWDILTAQGQVAGAIGPTVAFKEWVRRRPLKRVRRFLYLQFSRYGRKGLTAVRCRSLQLAPLFLELCAQGAVCFGWLRFLRGQDQSASRR